MELIQKRALRFLLNNRKSSYDVLLAKSDRSTLTLSRMRYVAVEVFKCLNGLNPKYVSQLFERKDVQYGLRHDNLILPNFITNRYGRKYFTYNDSHLWNTLPQSIKAANSLINFKKLIKDWIGPNCCKINDNF